MKLSFAKFDNAEVGKEEEIKLVPPKELAREFKENMKPRDASRFDLIIAEVFA